MIEKEYFARSFNIDLHVSNIGISKDEWYCHEPGMTQEEVRETMLSKGYDVVPILNKHKELKNYFSIDKSNNTKLIVNSLDERDTLYYLTHVRDAVWQMNHSKKKHYFLTNGRREGGVVGLLSLSNFNCREFYVYIFSLLSYVEREFAHLIESDKKKGFELLEKYAHNSDLSRQLDEIKKRFQNDEAEGNENDYKEYLYLHHLVFLIKSENKFMSLNYSKASDFEDGIRRIKELRNRVAHPVKSLVRSLEELHDLDCALNKLYEYKERLDTYLASKKQH